MTVLGFALFILGASGMDSDRILIPAVMAAAGMIILYMKGRTINGK